MKNLILPLLLLISTMTICQVCVEFETTLLNTQLTPADDLYGQVFYEENGIEFRDKYIEHLDIYGFNEGGTSIDDHVQAGYTDANGTSSFIGNILFMGNAAVQINFQNLQYDVLEIEFDINDDQINSQAWYKVNDFDLDNLPSNITWSFIPQTYGMRVIVTGPIETIELSEFELAIDNLCVRNMVSATSQTQALANDIRLFPNPSNSQITIDGPASSEPTRILNMMGVEVQRINNSEREIQHNLNSGSYYLELSDNDRVFHKRFVIIN